MLHIQGYLWILYFILGVYVLLLLREWIHFLYMRFRLYIRLKSTGAELHALHPLWLFFSRPRKADFLIRSKSGITYAVRFVENWKRGTEYAIPSVDRWYYARNILLPYMRGTPMPIHLGFKKKWFGMDFRGWLAKEKIDAQPLWLCYPRPFRVVDRVYDSHERTSKIAGYELVTSATINGPLPISDIPYAKNTAIAEQGICLVDGASIIGILTREDPDI